MKKYTKLLLLGAFLLLTFQSFSQEKSQYTPKKERTLKAQAQEKEIEKFIADNLNRYKLTPERIAHLKAGNAIEQKEHGTSDKELLDNLLLTIKKQELRKLYFKQNPENGEYYSGEEKLAIDYICVNGDFEGDEEEADADLYNEVYDFSYINQNPVNYSCPIDTSTLTDITPPFTTINDFTQVVTLVDTDITISGGFEPNLHALPTPIDLPRVNSGNRAIRLNDATPNRSITSMSKPFTVSPGQQLVNFSYLFVAKDNGTGTATERPRFSAMLINPATNAVIDHFCLDYLTNTAAFNSVSQGGVANDSLVYTGWQCQNLSLKGTSTGTLLELVLTVSDGIELAAKNIGIVYIDDICDQECPVDDCPDCIDITIDVSSGTDHQQAKLCINATNKITGTGTEAVYRAGQEVVLKDGFDALSGTVDRFHIEDCPGGIYVAKTSPPAKTQTSDETQIDLIAANTYGSSLSIYPNPVNGGELTIVSGDSGIKALSLYGLDGKLILAKQQGNSTNCKLDVSAIAAGMYLLSVETTDGAVTSHKIIRN